MKNDLGSKIKVDELCCEIVAHDLGDAKQLALLKQHGYTININFE